MNQLLLAGFGALIAAAAITLTSADLSASPRTGGTFLPLYVWSLKKGQSFGTDTCTHPTTLTDLLMPCDTGGQP
jgi:hypothetical protein